MFALNYDDTCLFFDETDASNDGIPDSVITHYFSDAPDYVSHTVWHTDIDGDTVKEVVVLLRTYERLGTQLRAIPLDNESGVLVDLTFDLIETCRTDDGSPLVTNFDFVVQNGDSRLPSISDIDGKSLAIPPQNHVDPGVYTLQFNGVPKNIYFDGTPPLAKSIDFDEARPSGTVIGTLTNDDHEATGPYRYELVNTCPTHDNYAFSIPKIASSNNQLRSTMIYDYEDDMYPGTDHFFVACVRVTDPSGAFIDDSLTVNVVDVNEPAEDIRLVGTEVYEGDLPPAVVGVLSTLGEVDDIDLNDPDNPEYALASSADCDGPANGDFEIIGDILQTKTVFDLPGPDTYKICVSSTDNGPNTIYKEFYIGIIDANEAPIALDDPDFQLILADSAGSHIFEVLDNDSDPEGKNLIVGELLPGAGPIVGGTISLVGSPATMIQFTPDQATPALYRLATRLKNTTISVASG